MNSLRVAVLTAAGSFAAFSVAQDAPPGGAVEGTVVNSATGAGIGGASVVFFGGPSTRYQATSDAVGHFKITGMTPGSYRINVAKEGFAQPALDLASFLSNSGLRVDADGDPVKVDLKLSPFDTIRGRVFGPDGKPAAGVEVSLYPNVRADLVVTDEEGRFTLNELRPGSYWLVAKPKSAKPQVASDGTRIATVTTYYPSEAEPSLGQRIVLGGQGSFGEYEIRMQTAQVHRVSGVVLDEEGRPAPGAELAMYPAPDGTPGPLVLSMRLGGLSVFALGMRPAPNGTPLATVVAGENGHFEFPTVRTGDWRINAASDPAREGVSARGSAGALVGRGDVDDLQIHIATPIQLTGTIEWKGDPPARQRVSNSQFLLGAVTLMNPDGNEMVLGGVVESGKLLFERVLPAHYQAIAGPGLAAQIFLGDYEVTGQAFTVTAGSPPLRVVLKRWAGAVRGTVEKCDGGTVALIPQRVEGVALAQTVACNADGSFELGEVSPGDYYVAAFDHLGGLLPSAAMLSLVPSRGTSVKVEEGATANVMLSAIALPR